MSKRHLLLGLTLIVILAILVWLTPPEPVPHPPEWESAPPPPPMATESLSEAMRDLTPQLEALGPVPMEYQSPKTNDAVLETHGPIADLFLERSKSFKRSPCAPTVSDIQRIFEPGDWDNWRSFPAETRLFLLLLTKADHLLQSGDETGLDYLEAAARIPNHFYRNPPSRELFEATKLYSHLAVYILNDMPREWYGPRLLCWFPTEPRIRASLKSMLDADFPILLERFETHGLQGVLSGDISWFPGIILKDFVAIKQMNRNHFVQAYHQWSHYYAGPLDPQLAPQHPYPDGIQILHMNGPVRVFLSNLHWLQIPAQQAAFLDMMVDRIQLEVHLNGHSKEPQWAMDATQELGLKNILNDQPYTTNEAGDWVVHLSQKALNGITLKTQPKGLQIHTESNDNMTLP